MTRFPRLASLGLALAALAAPLAAQEVPLPDLPPVRNVRFVSASGMAVDESYVRAHVAVKPGDPYSRIAVGRDVSTLLRTERFTDVNALVEEVPGGVDLIFKVTPKPKLGSPLVLTGAKAIRPSRVQDELDLQPGDWVDELLLARKAKQVEDLYRKEGFAHVDVRGDLRITDTNAGLCAVSVEVTEGEPSRLSKVAITGNDAASDGSLRRLLGLPQAWNPWFWFRKPNYDERDMKLRIEDVRNHYRDLGYLDADVQPPVAAPVEYGRLRLVVDVDEGPLYTVGNIQVRGVKLFPLESVKAAHTLKNGDVAAMTAIRAAAKGIRDFYGSRGYIRTVVEPVLTPAGPAVMDVTFDVREGRLTHIGDVIIRGNAVTKEKVIRREVNVYPGEIFNEVKVAQTERRLMNLNYFENVVGYPVATPVPGTNDLVIDVVEKPTGLFTVGAGFSSIDQLMGYVEVSQGNFDLLGWPHFTGGGQRLKVGLRAGTRMNEYTISLTEPWFLDRPLSLTVEGYTMSRSYSDYDIERVGGSTALGFPIFEGFARQEVRYRLERVSVTDVEDEEPYTDVDGSTFYFNEDDAHTDSTLSTLLSRDRRDNIFTPTRGYRVSTGAALTGGPLGFDTDLYSFSAKAENHIPLWRKHVLSLRASAETVESYGGTDEVPLSERYFLGGPRTVRGIKYRDAGPKATREVVNPDGTTYTEFRPRGGQTMMLAGAEYGIPLIPRIRFALFYDVGTLAVDPYDFSTDELAWGTGIGLRLDIPGFPVRLDYAVDSGVLTDRDEDDTDTERWSFWIGYGF